MAMNFHPVPIEDIRANRMSFEDFIMRCFDRMDIVLPECVKDNKYNIVDAKIRLLDAVTYPFHKVDAVYNEEVRKIEKKLNEVSDWDYNSYKVSLEWIKLLSQYFQQIGVIGATPTSITLGRGEENAIQQDANPYRK